MNERRHNATNGRVRFEVRLFNSLTRRGAGAGQVVELEAGSNVGDALRALDVPLARVHLALVNGRDITPALHGPVRTDYYLQDGDVLALSGPVPYSYGYGAPVV